MENWFPALLALGEVKSWFAPPSASCGGGLSGGAILFIIWVVFWLGFLTGAALVIFCLCPSARQLLATGCRQLSLLLNPDSETDLRERVHNRLQRYRLR